MAREFRINVKKDISDALSREGPALSIVAETIHAECSAVPEPTFPRPVKDVLTHGLRFAFTKGNVTSYLLAKVYIEENSLTPLEHSSATEFCRELSNIGFKWDIGVFPESTVELLERENREVLGMRAPVKVAMVAISHPEIVGVTYVGIAEIEKVYHFKGISARKALSRLLKEHRVDTGDLTGPALLPLLRCWRKSFGILAKSPLSRFYGLLCREEIRNKWGPIWGCEEPLWLVASKALLEADGGPEIAHSVAWKLKDISGRFLDDPVHWANRARSEGLLEYCAQLLEGTPNS